MKKILFLLLLPSLLYGHAVEQVYSKFTVDDEEWSLLFTFDIGLNDEDAGNPNTPQKPRSYLLGLSEEEHAKLREKTEQTLRSVIKIEPVDYEISFPGYEETPYTFPDLRIDGAYLHVKMHGPHPQRQALTLEPLPGPCPLFVVHRDDTFSNVWVADVFTLLPTVSVLESEKAQGFDFYGFLKVGFVHVVPDGWDHVLFVIGLCLLQLKLRPVLWQSLAFTVAHSVTLGFAAAGYLPAGGRWVELLIAASIAVMGFSSLRESKLEAWRIALVFVFGLIHGMGFAGALAEPLQESSQFLPALASMNLGVELAQVAVILIVVAFFSSLKKESLQNKARILLAIGIGLSGLWLTAERLLVS